MNTAIRKETTRISIEQRDGAPTTGPVDALAPTLPGVDADDAFGGERTVTTQRRVGSGRTGKVALLAVVLVLLFGLVAFLGGRSASPEASASSDVAAAVEAEGSSPGPGGIMSGGFRYDVPLSDKAGGW